MKTLPFNWQLLRQEHNTRQAVRTSLTDWAKLALAPRSQVPARHHHRLIAELERLANGDTQHLLLLLPPGSAKSTYASVLFPAWWFVHHPGSSIIAASHTAGLAQHFGRQVRELVVEHGQCLGYTLLAGNRSAGRWSTSAGGEYFAAGVRGPITGRRADLAIIDDPIKSHAEADSAVFRDRVWNWYRSDLITRLKPNGRIVLIMTRWHEDDLGGRLLSRHGELWRTLRLPAIAEAEDPLDRPHGAPLWPEWESAEDLARKRLIVGERVWSAMYQQTPRPPDGALFTFKHVAMLDALPIGGQSVRAWDFAGTAKLASNNPDYTVGLKLHCDENQRFTITDITRLRAGTNEVEALVLQTAKLDGRAVAISLPQDPGSAGKFAATYLTRQLAGHHVIVTAETGSKRTRATPVASQLDAGNVALLRANWNPSLIDELREFPFGSHDDQVDALSRAFATLIDISLPSRRLTIPFFAR